MYRNGREEGGDTAWYMESAQIKYLWNKKNGKKHGLQTTFYEDGTIQYQEEYENGVEIK